MLHIHISLLVVFRRVKRVFVFPQIFRFDPSNSVKQNANIFHVVQLDTVALLLISPQSFSSTCCLRIMLHVCFSYLGCAQRS